MVYISLVIYRIVLLRPNTSTSDVSVLPALPGAHALRQNTSWITRMYLVLAWRYVFGIIALV